MNLEHILELYKADSRVHRIAKRLKGADLALLSTKGMIGAQQVLVMEAARTLVDQCFMVIASDKEEAAFWFNDLSRICAKEVLFFPDSYRRPGGFDKLDRTNILQRTETVSKMVRFKNHIPFVGTYP